MMDKKIKLNLRVEVSFDQKTYKKLSNHERIISGTATIRLQEESWTFPISVFAKVTDEVIWKISDKLPKTIHQKIQKVYTNEKILEMFKGL